MEQKLESSTENFKQAIHRFILLAMVMPDQVMSLIHWKEEGNYQILLGKEPPYLQDLRQEHGGAVKIEASWRELSEWYQAMRPQIGEVNLNANAS